MAYSLPDIAVTGAVIEAAWGNAVRGSLAETAPAKATTKGDLWVATGLNAGARVGFTGAGGQILITDAAEASGVGWHRIDYANLTQPHAVSGSATLGAVTGVWAGALIGDASSDGSAFATLMAWDSTAWVSSVFDLIAYIVSPQTGNLRYNYTVFYGAFGEDKDTHTVTQGTTTLAMTADQINKVTIASLSGIADNDLIGIQFEREGSDGADTITDLYVLGFVTVWTPRT